jgi:undecaprenyl-diphosphatase
LSILHLLVLAIVQGLTEFLPISSSGHLILVPLFLGWPDQGLLIDIAVHVGTLAAVCLYWRGDLAALATGLWRAVAKRRWHESRLLMLLVLATLPVIAAGFVLERYGGGMMRQAEIIGWMSIIFGVVLYVVDRFTLRVRRIEHMTVTQALIIGVAQCLSLVPGVSRAGITMTAARLFGYERTEAARFSMLLSIPTILGAGTLALLEIAEASDAALGVDFLIAAVLSCLAALGAIWGMMAWLKRASFTPFVVYRVLLGAAILYAVYA